MRIDLDVPFKDKQDAKALGARWAPVKRCWDIVDVEALDRFMRWIAERLKVPYEIGASFVDYHSRLQVT